MDSNKVTMAEGQNGNLLPPGQMQNSVAGAGSGSVAQQNLINGIPRDGIGLRRLMQIRVYSLLQQRHPSITDAASKAMLIELAKRIENCMLRTAKSKEEYLDMQTLKDRVDYFLKQFDIQRRANPSNSVSTMVQTPGVSIGRNQNFAATSAVDNNMIPSNSYNNIPGASINTDSLLQASHMHGGSMLNGSHQFSTGYHNSSFGTMSQDGMVGQMIPTPGFKNNNGNSSLQSPTNVDTSTGDVSNTLAFGSGVGITPQFQSHHTAGSNGSMAHNLGHHTVDGFSSISQHKSSVRINAPLNAAVQRSNEAGSSQGSLSSMHFPTMDVPLQQPEASQTDRYGMRNSESFGAGNSYRTVTSSGSMANTQHMNLNPMPRVDASVPCTLSSLQAFQQVPLVKSDPLNQLGGMSFQTSFASSVNMPQVHHQPFRQFEQQGQFAQQLHCGQYQQPQHLQNKDAYVQSQQQPQHLQNKDAYVQSQTVPGLVTEQAKKEQHQPFHQFEQQGQFSQQRHCGQYQQPQHVLNKDAYAQSQTLPGLVTEQVKQEPHMDCYNKAIEGQVKDELKPSKFPNHGKPNSVKDHCVSSHLTTTQIFQPRPRQMQQMSVSWRDSCNLSVGAQQSSQDFTQMKNVRVDLCNGIPKGHRDGPSAKVSINSQTIAAKSTNDSLNNLKVNESSSKQVAEDCSPNHVNQRRWLLFLWHARACCAAKSECRSKYCDDAKNLVKHIESCQVPVCGYRYCLQTRKLLQHHKRCRSVGCPVCVYVNKYIEKWKKQYAALKKAESRLPSSSCSHASYNSLHASGERRREALSDVDDVQPSKKRVKVEHPQKSVSVCALVTEGHSSMHLQEKDTQQNGVCKNVSSEATPKIIDPLKVISEQEKDDGREGHNSGLADEKQDNGKCTSKGMRVVKDQNAKQIMDSVASVSKCGKSKIKGVSLIELFTPEQVRDHIRGLRQWVGQSKSKAERNKVIGKSMTENSCQLCAVEKLAFEPAPIYCTPCGARIKRNAMHYTVVAGESRHYVCIACYNEARGNTIAIDATPIAKSRFDKKKNDEVVEEWWVQCDKCEAWQHQICALFNGRRNHGQTEYTCPNCYIQEVEQGEREPLPQTAVLGAKDLPTTILSNHIEQRLFKKLKQERQERARVEGKSIEEVPGAESLVVRVVSSVDKMLEVKSHFLDLFREENYPSEFPYKSKAILLFQKIEGVEVCLFSMYVQEFGTDASFPNQRRVYLSYLDSVKYFRPEIRTVSGEALRTFVYHEILIAYLEYCKKRGFTSCYIWACPPLKGEDYILYCHPEIQKTPKTDKLREWYLAMLKKATKEKVVVECTNFYEHFLIQSGESKAKVTAARLPYFDGDYWPGAAEDLIQQMSQQDDGKKSNRKGLTKKVISKRALKAAGQLDLSANASKDMLLMHKLGEIIGPMKEDFIMVHLQHCCKHCCTLMVSGTRWTCSQCKNFHICDKCYEVEQSRVEREKHPTNQKEKHAFYPVAITDIPSDIEDKDDTIESEFFDTRHAFLSLCQGNHYQYDTLRRAKHSSMMVLYHLHDPTAPAFVTTCTICQQDIDTCQGWRCSVCPDYDVCNACYSKGVVDHPHKLIARPSAAEETGAQKPKANNRIQQLRELLLHAAGCGVAQCGYPECRKVRLLFRHGTVCKVRHSGGCSHCKLIWTLLKLHARSCRKSQCNVPRCRDLRVLYRRQQQQSDSRRRAAVTEMMMMHQRETSSPSN